MHLRSISRTALLTLGVVLSSGFANLALAVVSNNTCTDYSPASYTPGNWAYGWSAAATGSPFGPLSTAVNPDPYGNDTWWRGAGDAPVVFHNGTLAVHGGPTTLQPGQCGLHPGAAAEYAIYRWTAPAMGAAMWNVTFAGDLGGEGFSPATTHVLVVRNNTIVLDTDYLNLNGRPNQASMSGLVGVFAGDVIDFKVGDGGNGYIDDGTTIDATVELDPVVPTQGTTWGRVKTYYR